MLQLKDASINVNQSIFIKSNLISDSISSEEVFPQKP